MICLVLKYTNKTIFILLDRFARVKYQVNTNIGDSDAIFYWLRDIPSFRRVTHPCWISSSQSGRVIQILLLLSGQVEANPGPYTPKYPCMVCLRAVKWGQRALACDSCDKWCHLSCMAMASSEYNHLANTSTTWICSSCNSPNHSRIFDSITAVSNSFESLSLEQTSDSFHSLTVCSPSSSIGSPKATSSPSKPKREPAKPVKQSLRTVVHVINFQSIKNKVQEAQVLIESAEPDIIIGTETWLNPSIYSSEVLPNNYAVFRRDRADSHGGVLIAVKDDLVCTPVATNRESELISVKVRINRSKSIIVAAFYRPPNESTTEHAQTVLDELARLRQEHSKSEFWIGGDFNLPNIDWQTLAVKSNQYPAAMSSIYLNIPGQCGVEQLVEAPTRGEQHTGPLLHQPPIAS